MRKGTRLSIPSKKLIYFGKSLGSGVAVQMATERPPGLLVLQAPYTSVETRAAELYPFVIGVRHLVRDKYELAVENRQCRRHRFSFCMGRKTPSFRCAMPKALFAAANEPKTMVVYSEAHHDDFSGEQILTPLMKTARKYGLI